MGISLQIEHKDAARAGDCKPQHRTANEESGQAGYHRSLTVAAPTRTVAAPTPQLETTR
jgi:hypothetical protein